MEIVMLDKKGFSLIEIMISLVITLIIFMGLLQGALVTIDSNILNDLREEATHIAHMEMNAARSMPFTILCCSPLADDSGTVNRNFKRMTVGFDWTRTVTPVGLDPDNLEVEISITWDWKTQSYSTTSTSYVSNLNLNI